MVGLQLMVVLDNFATSDLTGLHQIVSDIQKLILKWAKRNTEPFDNLNDLTLFVR